MKIILETDRLLLREFVMDDAAAYFRMISDPDVTRYTGDDCKSMEEARARLEERVLRDYRERGFGRLAAVDRQTRDVIGFAGLRYLDDAGEVDLGYRFFKEHWGKGLATEASRPILDHGFGTLHLTRIIGIADVANAASIRVLGKLGFRFEKYTTFREHEVAWHILEAPII